ncbi:Uncharacterised protein [Zhongshania aliphaticivorans]|uniref:DNA repair protein n=1 Tax=Zhongshania aliphaticivorans TaxID=1470434 RepID=A0A5S9PJ10_9GAMM|nr:DUF2959 domain-containing protein [Zhongshania aliphaticivorans]CAA0104042.1 Uncharacterised protein [Zhongshania aliphaticivorans]CAA0104215.1 Uncharacterised protein [Zhongshania aliphaticivorans]
MRVFISLLALTFVFSLTGCESTYYNAMEKVGVHKRDILVDRVGEAKEAQQETQEQFKDALTEFRSVVSFDGGDLEKYYNRLNNEFEDSEAAAQDLSSRIDKVESVAEALFDEWQDELELYSNARLRSDSANKLQATKRQYASLIKSMRSAEKSVDPVLNALRDNVLYLKHNLNASAIGALKGELAGIDRDVQQLIAAMEKAINESDAFIKQLK